jgi:hypothetical protein
MADFPAKKVKAQKDLSQAMTMRQEAAPRLTTSEPQGGLMAVQSAGNQAMNQRAKEIQSASANMSPPVQGNISQLVSKKSPASDLIKASVSGYQLSLTTIEEIRNDVTKIVRELQAVFPDRALIVSLLSKWEERDLKLSSLIGSPHLDKAFSLLEFTIIEKATWRTAWMSLERKAIDELIYVMNKPALGDTFRHQMRSSVAYRDYIPEPEISAIWQWEAMLAAELFDDLDNGNYESAWKKLDKVNITDRDDVAVALVSRISDKMLLSIAKSEDGNDFLTRLYDELSSGYYGDDEKRQAERIFKAKNAVFAINKTDLEEGLLNTKIKIFPRRKTGITVGALGTTPAAHISAWRSRPGYIWVQLNPGVFTSLTYRKEVESLGNEVFWNGGIEIPENEIVKVIQYDEGGTELYCPAFHLLQISNEDTTHTFQKIGEVAGYALMFGPGAAAEGGVEAVTFAAKAARFLRIADKVAAVLGGITSVLLEHRGWLIKEFGRPLVEAIDRINSAIMIYGFVRMATQMPRLVVDYKKAYQAWRKDVQERKNILKSTEEEWSAVTNFDDANQGLDKAIKDTQAANNNLEWHEEGANLPPKSTQEASISTPPPPLEREPKIPVSRPEGEPKISVEEMEFQEAMSKAATRPKPKLEPEVTGSVAEMESVEAINKAAARPKPQTESEAKVAENAPSESTSTEEAVTATTPVQKAQETKQETSAPGKDTPSPERKADSTSTIEPSESSSTSEKTAESPTPGPGYKKYENVEAQVSELQKQIDVASRKKARIEADLRSPQEKEVVLRNELRRRNTRENSSEYAKLSGEISGVKKKLDKVQKELSELRGSMDKLKRYEHLGPLKTGETVEQLSDRWFRQLPGEPLSDFNERLLSIEQDVLEISSDPERGADWKGLFEKWESAKRSVNDRMSELVKAKEKLETAMANVKVLEKEASRSIGESTVHEKLKQARNELSAAQEKAEQIEFGMTIGQFAENASRKSIQKSFQQGHYPQFENLRSLQNRNNTGLDLGADQKASSGPPPLAAFEIKGTGGDKAGPLSKAQSNFKPYIVDRLLDSASKGNQPAIEAVQKLESGDYGKINYYKADVTKINLATGEHKVQPLKVIGSMTREEFLQMAKEWGKGQSNFKTKYGLWED